MQDRVIENWLTSANELSFTLPFAQVLALQGHRILHISPKKATLEQGKDIISVDEVGLIHCYQLKGDDITLSRWRTEVKPEVEAMTDLPPQHPSIKRTTDWRCHLIVNGVFRGEAAREVADTQRAWEDKGHRSFDVMVRGELLLAFTKVYAKYLPKELADFTAFVDLYREDGREPVNKAALAQLLESFFATALAEAGKRPTKNDIRQQINAALVSVSYLLANKYKSANHIAVMEGWLILLGYILAVAERNSLGERYWQPAVGLVEQAIDEAIDELLDELDQRVHYAEPSPVPFADSYFYKVRVTIVVGYLSAYGSYRRLKGDPSPNEGRIKAFLDKTIELQLLTIVSEGSMPHLANMTIFYFLLGEERPEPTISGLGLILDERQKGGMFDPYADVQDLMRSAIRITVEPVERNSSGISYALYPLVLLLAHLGVRDVLTAWWPPITEVSSQEVWPAQPWQWFFWRCKQGKQQSRFLPQTQSWKELVDLARTADDTTISTMLRERPWYLPLFFEAMPHRMSGYAVRTLISALPTS